MSPSHLHLVPPAAPPAPPDTAAGSGEPPLVIQGLEAGYGPLAVLRGIDLTISAGSVTVLTGPNGAGKSTLVRAICGRLAPKAGRIAVCGHAPDQREARRHIGLAPQEIALYGALTVAENLAVFAELAGLGPAEGRARVERVMARTGIAARQDERIDRLSGGWQRRANLAAALMGAPRLLLLDEPTVGVDAPAREGLATLVRALAREGLGLLLVTHDFEFAEAVANRVAILKGGRLLLEGALSAVLEARFAHQRAVEVTFATPPPALRLDMLASLGLTVEGARARGLISDAPRAAGDLLTRLDGMGLRPSAVTLKTPGLSALYGAVVAEG